MSSASLLVRLPNPVGDVVMATPLLRSLRQQCPGVPIVACGNPQFGPLLEGLDSVDSFVPLHAGGIRAQAAQLRTIGADRCLLLPNSWSSALCAWWARIPVRVGRRAAGRELLLTRRLPAVGPARPMTEIYLEMLAGLDLQVPARDQAPAAELSIPSPVPTEPEFLGVAPGAAFGASKIYPLELLVEAVDLAVRDGGLPPLLIGAAAERPLLEEVAAALTARGLRVELPPPGDLAAAKSHLARCAALLTMDSGARHIAAALGVPQVVLYGPTHPGWSAHRLDTTIVLRAVDVDCLGCHHPQCPIDHRCMRRIAPQQVAKALLHQSQRTRPPTGARVRE